MALKPGDLFLSEYEKKCADLCEAVIDGTLEKEFLTGVTREVRIPIEVEFKKTREEITRRYSEAGWKVTWDSYVIILSV